MQDTNRSIMTVEGPSIQYLTLLFTIDKKAVAVTLDENVPANFISRHFCKILNLVDILKKSQT